MKDKFMPGVMHQKFCGPSYISPERRPSHLPTLKTYLKIVSGPLYWIWRMAVNGKCDGPAWVYGCAWVCDVFESTGGRVIIEGMENIDNLKEPCVFIANHMSTLETFLLPGMIRPRRPVTFVVKRSLTTMPVFGPVMRSRDPVIVDRKNARDDLASVLTEGTKRLENGVSVVVFPQHTRSLYFDESKFNSIGIKLAKKAGVKVLPLALKTDAWGQGKKIKELGRTRPDLPARFKFGEAMPITGNGKKEHAEICRFIGETVAAWQAQDGINQ